MHFSTDNKYFNDQRYTKRDFRALSKIAYYSQQLLLRCVLWILVMINPFWHASLNVWSPVLFYAKVQNCSRWKLRKMLFETWRSDVPKILHRCSTKPRLSQKLLDSFLYFLHRFTKEFKNQVSESEYLDQYTHQRACWSGFTLFVIWRSVFAWLRSTSCLCHYWLYLLNSEQSDNVILTSPISWYWTVQYQNIGLHRK